MELRGNITNSAPERRALRVNEFCAAYGLSRSTAYKLMKTGKLRTVLIGGRRVVPVDAAEALLKGAAR
jgi:predicted DNA-binding transcriptional regulator AlpA